MPIKLISFNYYYDVRDVYKWIKGFIEILVRNNSPLVNRVCIKCIFTDFSVFSFWRESTADR